MVSGKESWSLQRKDEFNVQENTPNWESDTLWIVTGSKKSVPSHKLKPVPLGKKYVKIEANSLGLGLTG